MYQKILNSPFFSVAVVILVLVAIFGGALVLTLHDLSPIRQAVKVCDDPTLQPAWVTSHKQNLETSTFLSYEEYVETGRNEIWSAWLESGTFDTDADGQVKLEFGDGGLSGVKLEYRRNVWSGTSWHTPTLSAEEYNAYESLGQSFMALWGGDEKWYGRSRVDYTLNFNRQGHFVSVECPGGWKTWIP